MSETDLGHSLETYNQRTIHISLYKALRFSVGFFSLGSNPKPMPAMSPGFTYLSAPPSRVGAGPSVATMRDPPFPPFPPWFFPHSPFLLTTSSLLRSLPSCIHPSPLFFVFFLHSYFPSLLHPGPLSLYLLPILSLLSILLFLFYLRFPPPVPPPPPPPPSYFRGTMGLGVGSCKSYLFVWQTIIIIIIIFGVEDRNLLISITAGMVFRVTFVYGTFHQGKWSPRTTKILLK